MSVSFLAWFPGLSIFTPMGNDPISRAYVSNGLKWSPSILDTTGPKIPDSTLWAGGFPTLLFFASREVEHWQKKKHMGTFFWGSKWKPLRIFRSFFCRGTHKHKHKHTHKNAQTHTQTKTEKYQTRLPRDFHMWPIQMSYRPICCFSEAELEN